MSLRSASTEALVFPGSLAAEEPSGWYLNRWYVKPRHQVRTPRDREPQGTQHWAHGGAGSRKKWEEARNVEKQKCMDRWKAREESFSRRNCLIASSNCWEVEGWGQGWEIEALGGRISQVLVCTKSPRGRVKLWILIPRVQGGAWDSVFVTSSQGMPLLLVHGTHFE